MSAQVYLVSKGELPESLTSVELTGDEAHHAVKVKRTQVGEVIEICDGHGIRVSGTVTEVGKKSLVLKVNSRLVEAAPKLKLTVAQALAKGDRADLALEILTEVGVDNILPWRAELAIAKWEDDEKGKAKWQNTVAQASKQARRSWIPTILDVVTTAQLVEQAANFDVAMVLHESAMRSFADVWLPESGSILLIVGPEGGVSPRELELFSNLQQVRMGKTVMRTSTAGAIAAGAILSKTRWVQE
jgi:16S rRNA (uracil1498-N3)-methyltransferase